MRAMDPYRTYNNLVLSCPCGCTTRRGHGRPSAMSVRPCRPPDQRNRTRWMRRDRVIAHWAAGRLPSPLRLLYPGQSLLLPWTGLDAFPPGLPYTTLPTQVPSSASVHRLQLPRLTRSDNMYADLEERVESIVSTEKAVGRIPT